MSDLRSGCRSHRRIGSCPSSQHSGSSAARRTAGTPSVRDSCTGERPPRTPSTCARSRTSRCGDCVTRLARACTCTFVSTTRASASRRWKGAMSCGHSSSWAGPFRSAWERRASSCWRSRTEKCRSSSLSAHWRTPPPCRTRRARGCGSNSSRFGLSAGRHRWASAKRGCLQSRPQSSTPAIASLPPCASPPPARVSGPSGSRR